MLKSYWSKNVKRPLNSWLNSVNCALWKIADTPLPRLHKWLPWDVALTYAVLLTAVVLLLSACTTQPQQPCERLMPITLPALSEPLPSVNYSLQAQTNIETWQKKLGATSLTSKP